VDILGSTVKALHRTPTTLAAAAAAVVVDSARGEPTAGRTRTRIATGVLIGNGCGEAIELILKLIECDGTRSSSPHPTARVSSTRATARTAACSASAAMKAPTPCWRPAKPDLVISAGHRLRRIRKRRLVTNLLSGRLIHIDSCEEN